jgi:hypothetical protein
MPRPVKTGRSSSSLPHELADRRRHERLDAEVSLILREDAERDLSVVSEFFATMADGLD